MNFFGKRKLNSEKEYLSLIIEEANKKNKEIDGSLKYINPDGSIIKGIYSIGVSAALMQALLAVLQLIELERVHVEQGWVLLGNRRRQAPHPAYRRWTRMHRGGNACATARPPHRYVQ